jgi:hypothetical protein
MRATAIRECIEFRSKSLPAGRSDSSLVARSESPAIEVRCEESPFVAAGMERSDKLLPPDASIHCTRMSARQPAFQCTLSSQAHRGVLAAGRFDNARGCARAEPPFSAVSRVAARGDS